jgi:hypothetical protein
MSTPTPAPAPTTALPDSVIARSNGTPGGSPTASTAPKATPKAAPKAPAAKAAPKAPAAKAAPAGRDHSAQLARNLVVAATVASQGLNPADAQHVANLLKVCTTGRDSNGLRWWPTQADLPKGAKPLPRPTHWSWHTPL